MIDMESKAGDEIERAVNRAALERNACYVVIGLAMAYLIARLIPWAAAGFHIAGR